MRTTRNIIGFLIFLGMTALVVYAIISGPDIVNYVLPAVGAALLIFMLLYYGKHFFRSMAERADGIYAVYDDTSGKGIHIYTHHRSTGGKYSSGNVTVQHYFIRTEDGKIFYRYIFVMPANRSIRSFETEVLQNPLHEKTMQYLSRKSGITLALGNRINGTDEFEYLSGGYKIHTGKFDNTADAGFRITCTENISGILRWERKI